MTVRISPYTPRAPLLLLGLLVLVVVVGHSLLPCSCRHSLIAVAVGHSSLIFCFLFCDVVVVAVMVLLLLMS